MKMLFKYNRIYLFGLLLAAMTACNPEDNEHFKIPPLESGGSVRATVDPNHAFFDVSNLANSRYVLDLEAFDFQGGKLVQQYDIYVSFVDTSEGTTSDTVLLKSVTQFPSRVEIAPLEIAQALSLPNGIDDFGAGDFFNFTMEVLMTDGRKFSRQNTSDDIVLEKSTRGTFLLSTFIGCPSFDISSLLGMYTVTKDEFEITLTETTEVVAGGPNQVVIKDAFGHGLDLTVTFDEQGIATVNPRQNTWVPQTYGLPASYGKGYSAGNGRAFSCIGMITLDFVFSVDIGTYGGVWNYTIVKQ